MYLCGKKRGESECTEVGVFHSVHTLNARSIMLSVNLDMVRKSDGLRDCQYLFVLFLLLYIVFWMFFCDELVFKICSTTLLVVAVAVARSK